MKPKPIRMLMIRRLIKTPKLTRQYLIAFVIMIVVIESAILLAKLQRKAAELNIIEAKVSQIILEKTGTISSLPLGQDFVNLNIERFLVSSVLTSLLIVMLVALGSMWIFHHAVSKHIAKIIELNCETTKGNRLPYPAHTIPNNEIGELISGRERMLSQIDHDRNNVKSSLKETRSQLVQAAKLSTIGELSATIAHDLKNPLAVVHSYSDMIIKKTDPHQVEIRKYAERILFSATMINQLVENMNRFHRQETELSENTSITEVFKNSRMLVAHKLRTYRINIIDKVPDDLPTCWGELTQLEQVVVNLLSNAADALEGQEKRDIILRAGNDANTVWFSISDNGPGIPESVRSKVFTPFFTTKEPGKGTGLGLSICKKIVERANGQLLLDSHPHTGTSIKVVLQRFAKNQSKQDTKAAA